jgi:hypothetical protein
MSEIVKAEGQGVMETRPFLPEKESVKVLVTGGASCPDGILQQIICKINGFFPKESPLERGHCRRQPVQQDAGGIGRVLLAARDVSHVRDAGTARAGAHVQRVPGTRLTACGRLFWDLLLVIGYSRASSRECSRDPIVQITNHK